MRSPSDAFGLGAYPAPAGGPFSEMSRPRIMPAIEVWKASYVLFRVSR